MSQELINTSAPRGLKPGSKGFCTVAMTAGLTTAWAERLESLSVYAPFSHWAINALTKTQSTFVIGD